MSSSYKNRIQEFKTALSEEKLDLKALRELCFAGIPFEGGIRSLCWKILLNYLPPGPDIMGLVPEEAEGDLFPVSKGDDHPAGNR
ncbi:hypothetical protein Q7C36_018673 [Tachysurus vachellii]|uniref:TBC1 domain family member 13 n=1 Tax=Tachysurus vachellii TaxID=175792 RepID=A0AA88M1H8_TACVA|nr:hypothetical protein Q7C36_018673 [Tachysurus vachellii]